MGIHVGHVALRVRDFARSCTFATDALGLRTTSSDAARALLSASEKHHELELIAADVAGLDHLGIEVDDEAELEPLRERVVRAGGTLLGDAVGPGVGPGFRVQGPGDLVFELYAAMPREPMSVELGLRGPLRRFGHVNVLCADPAPLVRFLIDGLGLRVSDTLGDQRTWLRCDAEHHGVVVGAGADGNRLHHYAFELAGWGAMRDYLDGFVPGGHRQLWGPVRHGPGFNIATYGCDPDGCVVEAYCEMQQIENDAAYVPVDWSSVPGARNLWGPEADPSFLSDNGVPILPAVGR